MKTTFARSLNPLRITMHMPLSLIRTLYFLLSLFFFATYAVTLSGVETKWIYAAIGILAGALFAAGTIGCEMLLKQFNLRMFNLLALGLLFGYFMGEIALVISSTAMEASLFEISEEAYNLIKGSLFLMACYFGMVLTLRAAQELYFTIPFVRFQASEQKRKEILLDISILSDPRLVDLAHSGLLDEQLIMPRFALQELQAQAESNDEGIKARARKSLETIRKLELLKGLDLRYADAEGADGKEYPGKLITMARHLNANILTAECSKVQQSELEGIKIININLLSHTLKPLTAAGEHLQIKIQRYGKEPRQGVGYLDDGTMVVVNGAAEYIGETIKAIVLSIKHTSSGRMIFCNAIESEGIDYEDADFQPPSLEGSSHRYFAV